MAYETGTAANQTDLFDKMVAFLTTNAELVADDQQWQKVWESKDVKSGGRRDCILVGPGLGGQQNVYVGLGVRADAVADERWLLLRGMSGVILTAADLDDHVNVNPAEIRFYADGNPMTYWITGSGRRFTGVVKISTVFEAFYGGLFLPYAAPTKYPYPLAIGGSVDGVRPSSENDSWRVQNQRHAAFPYAYASDAVSADTRSTSALHIMSPTGEWLKCSGSEDNGDNGYHDVSIHPTKNSTSDSFPTGELIDAQSQRIGPLVGLGRQLPNFDGSLALTPLTLCRRIPTQLVYGILDGCYHVAGVNNAAENVVTVDGVDHLVAQNTYRATITNYWALKLE